MTQFSSLYGTRLDRELGTDDSTNLFTTARRKSAINEGLEQFAEMTECWQKTSSVTIQSGVAEYDLGTVIAAGDFIRFSKEQVQFRYSDTGGNTQVFAGDDLIRRDVDWLNRYRPSWQVSTLASSNVQLPDVFYQRINGGQTLLGFSNTPCLGSSNQTADALVPYVAKPAPLTSDTSEPYSGRSDLKPWHQSAVHYGAYVLEKLRRDMQASQAQFQLFMLWVQRYQASVRVKNGTALTMGRNYFRTRRVERGTDPRT